MGCLAGSIWRRVARFGVSDIRLGAQEGRLDVPQGFLGARDGQFGDQIERLGAIGGRSGTVEILFKFL